MKASVNYVNSSMIVGIRVESEKYSNWCKKTFDSSYFTMVSKDNNGKKCKSSRFNSVKIEVRRFINPKTDFVEKENHTRKISITVQKAWANLEKYRVSIEILYQWSFTLNCTTAT
jgi:acyl-CoA hydrolase